MKRWYGKLLGVFAGAALFRFNPLMGAVIGLLIGHAFDSGWFSGKSRSRPGNPYTVLGVTSGASDAEVDQAYRRLISQFHPDRMSGAATELRRQAETRASEINGAYDRIKTLRKRR